MSLNETGFLSPDIQNWIAKHRLDSADGFRIAEALNAAGVKTLYTSTPANNDNRQLALSLLFARTLSHYQAALILCERGAVLSAKALMRVILEATFTLVAIVEDPPFYDLWVNNDRKRRADLIQALLDLPADEIAVPAEELEQLRQEVSALKSAIKVDKKREVKTDKKAKFGAFDAARLAGMLDFYRLFYVPYSNVVHTSLGDLAHHVNVDPAGHIASLKWGPQTEEVDDLVDAAIQIFFPALECTLRTFLNSEMRKEFENLWAQHQQRLKIKTKQRTGAAA